MALGPRSCNVGASMEHTIEHDLDLPPAKRAIDRAMQSYTERLSEYSPRFEWTSDAVGEFGFEALKVKVTGELVVADRKIDVSIDVPFILRPFRKRALAVIEREVREWVERAKNGEI